MSNIKYCDVTALFGLFLDTKKHPNLVRLIGSLLVKEILSKCAGRCGEIALFIVRLWFFMLWKKRTNNLCLVAVVKRNLLNRFDVLHFTTANSTGFENKREFCRQIWKKKHIDKVMKGLREVFQTWKCIIIVVISQAFTHKLFNNSWINLGLR